jgi:hypothetical protein
MCNALLASESRGQGLTCCQCEPRLSGVAAPHFLSRLFLPLTSRLGIRASGSPSAARHCCSIAERCSAAKVSFAAPKPGAPLPTRAVLHRHAIATGGSAGNQMQRSFFVLRKTRTRWR